MTMRRLRLNRVEGAAVAAGAILAYVNGFSATFQFDDRSVILDDERLRSLGTFAGHVTGMVRPLLKLTFFVDRQFYGVHPAGYHLLNLLLHAGSALLVYAILSTIVARTRQAAEPTGGRASTGDVSSVHRWVPLAAALLFAVHPLGSETVTYLSGRASGLAAFFTLLSVYLALRAGDAGASRAAFVCCAAGAVVAFTLALLSKETAIVLPALLLLVHLVFPGAGWKAVFRPRAADGGLPIAQQRGRAGRRRDTVGVRRATWVQAACWIVAGAFATSVAWHPGYARLAHASLETRPVWHNVLTEANAICYALSLFALPSRLNFDHDLRVYESVLQWPTPLSIALLVALAVFALLGARRMPLVTFGLGWLFLCMLPAHSLVPRYDILSERNLYLPSIGMYVAGAASLFGLVDLVGGARRWVTVAAAAGYAVAVAWLGVATADRNRTYRDEVTFWSDAARKSPQKSRPHTNLGAALMQAGDVDGAIREYRLALARDRENLPARQNLRDAWLEKQRRR